MKNIVFDVGKVLVSYEPRAYLERLGYDEIMIEELMQAVFLSKFWDENDKGIMPVEEIENGFVSYAPQYEKEIRKVFRSAGEAIELMPHAMEWIKNLKARGHHLYIISNYAESIYNQTKHKLKFLPYMDGVIFSYQQKVIKPDRRIYELLLEKYNLKAEECVFIDDRLENVEAARSVGFHVIHFHNYEQAKNELDVNILF